jgi:HSP20 family protein
MTNQTAAKTNNAEAKAKTEETSKAVTPARQRRLGFPDLFDEMDRLWDTFLPSPWRFRGTAAQRLMPALDVFEKDGKLHINAELPGMQDSDIEIEVADDVLTISGEKRDEREVKEDNYYRSERTYGSFRRQIALPAGADSDNVEAKFKDGVLKIEVPVKPTAPATKKIEVKAAD